MTIDTTFPTQPPRNRRPARSRRRLPRPRRHPSVRLRHLPPLDRQDRQMAISADEALHALVEDADVFRVGRKRYLVAPIDDFVLEALFVASVSSEDLEAEVDHGPEEIAEYDGLEDGRSGGWVISLEGDDCDREDDDPAEQDDHGGGNVEDGGELDPCDFGEPEPACL